MQVTHSCISTVDSVTAVTLGGHPNFKRFRNVPATRLNPVFDAHDQYE